MKNIRIRLQLPEAVLEVLQKLAERRGVAPATVLRQAISTESYFDSVLEEGRQVLTELNGEYRKVIFTHLKNDVTE